MKHVICFSGGKDSTALILWADGRMAQNHERNVRMTTLSPQAEQRKRKFRALYVVMFDGSDGPAFSADMRNPWNNLEAAQWAINHLLPKERRKMYYVVKYQPEKEISQ